MHLFSIRNENPADVTVSILFIYRRISTCFGPTGTSSGEFTQLFPQPLVQYWTNGCGNSCVNSPEDGPVGPKHVEIRRYMNKIETVTSVCFSFLMCKGNWQTIDGSVKEILCVMCKGPNNYLLMSYLFLCRLNFLICFGNPLIISQKLAGRTIL